MVSAYEFFRLANHFHFSLDNFCFYLNKGLRYLKKIKILWSVASRVHNVKRHSFALRLKIFVQIHAEVALCGKKLVAQGYLNKSDTFCLTHIKFKISGHLLSKNLGSLLL